jgi:hypothetical protein
VILDKSSFLIMNPCQTLERLLAYHLSVIAVTNVKDDAELHKSNINAADNAMSRLKRMG